MGRQAQLMWVGVVGYWGCGVPLGYTLAFHTNLHLSGLWFGSLTGALIVGKAVQWTLKSLTGALMSLTGALVLGQLCSYLLMAQSLHKSKICLCCTVLFGLPTHSYVILHCSHMHTHDFLQNVGFCSMIVHSLCVQLLSVWSC